MAASSAHPSNISQQTRLAQRVPLCMATMLGTHNTAITLADGYGNLDLYFEQYLKWIKWAVCLPDDYQPCCHTVVRPRATHTSRPTTSGSA